MGEPEGLGLCCLFLFDSLDVVEREVFPFFFLNSVGRFLVLEGVEKVLEFVFVGILDVAAANLESDGG